MTYQVRTDVFEGPLDLLLHLIAKRQLDVCDVSLAAITEDYLAHLETLQELDLELATEFLVVAATLVEMKASRLLPGPPRDDTEDLALSERDLLVARLLEYRAFKEAGAAFRALVLENQGYVGREAGPGPEYAHLCPDLTARTSPAGLAALVVRLLSPKPKPRVDLSHIAPIRASVTEAVAAMRFELERRKRLSFHELTRGCGARIEIVVHFLGLLELVKRDEVDISQIQTFGDIDVQWRGRRQVDPVVDEYEIGDQAIHIQEEQLADE